MSNKPSLAELLKESARNIEAERAHNAHAERITEDVKAQLPKRAETSKDYPSCPNCGAVLEGWRPDEETNGTGNDDDQNEQDNAGRWDNKVASVKAMIRSLAPGSTMR
jgi:hypothetical protein